jgi:kynurenine formamidase
MSGSLAQLLAAATVYDLSHPFREGMPHYPTQTPFQLKLVRRHGDVTRADGGSTASEVIITGGHVGTHIDALGHFSRDGLLNGGIPAGAAQTGGGLLRLGVDGLAPVLGRGVLLDVAGCKQTACLPAGYEVTAADLAEAAERVPGGVRAGDAVLIRTGWSAHWHDADRFVGGPDGSPGPGPGAAQWLIEQGAAVVGGETLALEVTGGGRTTLPVHGLLLVTAGIPIIECMQLQDLGEAGVTEFALVVTPLRLAGGTASPVRPLALVSAPE